jgi:hypothetical protein
MPILGYNVFVSFFDVQKCGKQDQQVVDEIETRGGCVVEFGWDTFIRRIRGYFKQSELAEDEGLAEQASRSCVKALENQGFDAVACEVYELVGKVQGVIEQTVYPINRRYGYNIFIKTGSGCVDEARRIIEDCGGRVYDVEEIGDGFQSKLRGYFQALAGCELAEKAAVSCCARLLVAEYDPKMKEWPEGSTIIECEPGRGEKGTVGEVLAGDPDDERVDTETNDFVASIEHEAWNEGFNDGWVTGYNRGYDSGYEAAEIDRQHDAKEVLTAAELYSAELNDGTDEREEAFDKGFSAGVESVEATASAVYGRGFDAGTEYGMELADDIDDELEEEWHDAADDLDWDDEDDEDDEDDDGMEDGTEYGMELEEDEDDEYKEDEDDGIEDSEDEAWNEGYDDGANEGVKQGRKDLFTELMADPQRALALYRLAIASVTDAE